MRLEPATNLEVSVFYLVQEFEISLRQTKLGLGIFQRQPAKVGAFDSCVRNSDDFRYLFNPIGKCSLGLYFFFRRGKFFFFGFGFGVLFLLCQLICERAGTAHDRSRFWLSDDFIEEHEWAASGLVEVQKEYRSVEDQLCDAEGPDVRD